MIRTLFQKSLPFLGLALLGVCVIALAILSSARLASRENAAAVNAAKVFALTNEERSDKGVANLTRNALLDHAAQMKAEDMASKGYYAHVSPSGLTPMYWVEKAGYRYLIIGENLVVNRTDAEQVIDAFMGSPGHRANILRSDFTEIGVGVAHGTYKDKDATFTVQIFAAPYPRAAARPESSKVIVKPSSTPAKAPTAPKKTNSLPVSQPLVTPRGTTTAETIAANPLTQKVKEIIKPFIPAIEATSTATSTGEITIASAPTFLLTESAPIALADVSRLGTEELPPQIGSTWSKQFEVFVSDLYRKVRSLIGS